MKNMIKSIMICFLVCLTIGNVYGAEVQYITETEFISSLNGLGKQISFTPNAAAITLTRERAAALLVQYLGYEAIADDMKTQNTFADVTSSKGEIALVSQLGLMQGIGDNLFSLVGQRY